MIGDEGPSNGIFNVKLPQNQKINVQRLLVQCLFRERWQLVAAINYDFERLPEQGKNNYDHFVRKVIDALTINIKLTAIRTSKNSQ